MSPDNQHDNLLQTVKELGKRRGLIFLSGELYGGLQGFWDYGHYGAELKRAIHDHWWEHVVRRRGDIVGLDSALITNPDVWRASGHVDEFHDLMVDDHETKERFKLENLEWRDTDHIGVAKDVLDSIERTRKQILSAASSGDSANEVNPDKRLLREDWESSYEALLEKAENEREKTKSHARMEGHGKLTWTQIGGQEFFRDYWEVVEEEIGYIPASPSSGSTNLTRPKTFNLMFKTYVGPVEDESNIAYLRPETCQPIFVHFQNLVETQRKKVPFGIAQTGKAFRNEISPKRYIFRSREFSQLEMEYFVHPSEKEEWFDHWVEERMQWYEDIGIDEDNLRLRPHREDELAHYAQRCEDIEFDFPWGWGELEGIADRTDYDLKQHQEHSGKDLQYFDQQRFEGDDRWYLPHVVETSAGLDRTLLTVLFDAYSVDYAETSEEAQESGHDREEERVYLDLAPEIAPVQVGVFPLYKNKHGEQAQRLADDLRKNFRVEYDDSGSIGKRYRRYDEIGTPWCITWDFDSDEEDTVTIRDRDSMEQVRIATDKLTDWFDERLEV